MHVYDYLVVGQGIAGTMVIHHLLAHTENIFVVDAEEHTASFAAAGIINPITGRNYVKSWMIDILLPYAIETYEAIAQKFGILSFQKLNILRTINSIKEQNDWEARKIDPEYQQYIVPHADITHLDAITKEKHEYGEITGSLQVKLKEIILAYRSLLIKTGRYQSKKIESSSCIRQDDHYEVDGIRAKKIIFCEGINALHNPLFKELPLISAKGNAVIMQSDIQLTKNVKDKYFMTRIDEDHYWIGSDYVWHTLDVYPDEPSTEKMIETTQLFFNAPMVVKEKLAGLRPTTKNRRPILGQHQSMEGIYIFNGLGTKGSSLSPYFAKMLIDYIIIKKPLEDEVNQP